MVCHFRAWLRSRLKLGTKTRCHASRISKPQTTAPSTQEDSPFPPPPPPYTTLSEFSRRSIHELPSSIDGSESLEVLRARNPATWPPSDTFPLLRPPRDEARPVEAAKFAAQAAAIGMINALHEPNPMMVAARTAQAITVAVSTSRSYAAFVAAVTAAEKSAFLLVEDYRDSSSRERVRVRQINALETATDVATAADAGITPVGAWPFNIHDSFALHSLKAAYPLPD